MLNFYSAHHLLTTQDNFEGFCSFQLYLQVDPKTQSASVIIGQLGKS